MPAKHTRKVSLLEDLTTKLYVDCHPNFVSGLRVNRLLGFPKLASGTGKAQARTVVDSLEEWEFLKKWEHYHLIQRQLILLWASKWDLRLIE